jgi:hypothetical protein
LKELNHRYRSHSSGTGRILSYLEKRPLEAQLFFETAYLLVKCSTILFADKFGKVIQLIETIKKRLFRFTW